jgi:hypothetical protein
MKRRRALSLIGLAAAGAVVFPACEFTSVPLLDNLSIDKSQYKKLQQLSAMILPIPEEMILEKMSPTDFTLVMMDDCEKQADIDQFKSEMDAFFKENSNIGKLELSELSGKIKDSLFLQKVKNYNVSYYKGLENYLITYTDFEFIPSRFVGCAKV